MIYVERPRIECNRFVKITLEALRAHYDLLTGFTGTFTGSLNHMVIFRRKAPEVLITTENAAVGTFDSGAGNQKLSIQTIPIKQATSQRNG